MNDNEQSETVKMVIKSIIDQGYCDFPYGLRIWWNPISLKYYWTRGDERSPQYFDKVEQAVIAFANGSIEWPTENGGSK